MGLGPATADGARPVGLRMEPGGDVGLAPEVARGRAGDAKRKPAPRPRTRPATQGRARARATTLDGDPTPRDAAMGAPAGREPAIELGSGGATVTQATGTAVTSRAATPEATRRRPNLAPSVRRAPPMEVVRVAPSRPAAPSTLTGASIAVGPGATEASRLALSSYSPPRLPT